jgi:hypothetical protein
MVILAGKYGQMANRMWSLAHGLANAWEGGYRLAYPGFGDYAEYFVGTAGSWVPGLEGGKGKPFPGLRRWGWSWGYRLSEKLAGRCGSVVWEPSGEEMKNGEVDLAGEAYRLQRERAEWLFLRGWGFRDWGALWRQRERLRSFFALEEPWAGRVSQAAEGMKAGREVLVGVHVRRGDYAKFAGGEFYFALEEYRGAMERMVELIGAGGVQGERVRFLVCGNEAGVAEAEVWKGLEVVGGTGVAVEDLALLGKCDYLVGPPSTFSMWASFFGGVRLAELTKKNGVGRGLSLEDFRVYGMRD